MDFNKVNEANKAGENTPALLASYTLLKSISEIASFK